MKKLIFLFLIFLWMTAVAAKPPEPQLGKIFVQNSETGRWDQLTSQKTDSLQLYCEVNGKYQPCVIVGAEFPPEMPDTPMEFGRIVRLKLRAKP